MRLLSLVPLWCWPLIIGRLAGRDAQTSEKNSWVQTIRVWSFPRNSFGLHFRSVLHQPLGDLDLYNIGTVRYITIWLIDCLVKILMCQRRPCGPLQGRRCPRNVGLLAGSLGQIGRRLSSGNLDLRQGHHGIRSLAIDGEVWVPAADSLGITDFPNPFFGQHRAAPVNEPRTLKKYWVTSPPSNTLDTIKPPSFPWICYPNLCLR